ncbi:MAG: 30S ribosomal protein S2 [Parcubacteria group bacterium CG11_big_fil_rev_8_21_14_0_20_39_14]|nr:MAG: 30S ribosomal protein S2 [Parcubacteria group bacterium CG11_big_fil_rev_8_21_14_0_20_39_14]PIS35786.1 MAG: 30S ribosomal protein S2 [Parcubacteria group bacterium CG08_land_8_20_14_0_20_38_56]
MSEETANVQEKKAEAKSEEKDSADLIIDVDEMVKAGVYFGHRKSKRHPKMKPYIFTVKNNVDIIDLQQSAEKLKGALEFLQKIIRDRGKILFVGTRLQAKNSLKDLAEATEMPYVNERWLGGFLTNFQTMLKRIEYFNELQKKKESGEFEKYSKKERIKLDKELKNLEEKFGGVKEIKKLPEALFILDLKKDALAGKEAKRLGIPVVAVCDTNTDPDLSDWPIPANDDAISSIKYILEKVKEAILKAKEK